MAMLLAAALRETKGCIRRVNRGYRSVLVFYSGWAGLCLAQWPNLNFRLLVLFLIFNVSLKKSFTYFYFLEIHKIKVTLLWVLFNSTGKIFYG